MKTERKKALIFVEGQLNEEHFATKLNNGSGKYSKRRKHNVVIPS